MEVCKRHKPDRFKPTIALSQHKAASSALPILRQALAGTVHDEGLYGPHLGYLSHPHGHMGILYILLDLVERNENDVFNSVYI